MITIYSLTSLPRAPACAAPTLQTGSLLLSVCCQAGYFEHLRQLIEGAVAQNSEPAIIIAHSMGGLVSHYFLTEARLPAGDRSVCRSCIIQSSQVCAAAALRMHARMYARPQHMPCRWSLRCGGSATCTLWWPWAPRVCALHKYHGRHLCESHHPVGAGASSSACPTFTHH